MDRTNDELLEIASRMTPQWTAGFFDGEGCVDAKLDHGGRGYAVRVSLTQKDPTTLILLSLKFPRATFRERKVIRKDGVSSSTVYNISWAGTGACEILNYIKDYLVIKKEQALLALEFASLITTPGGRIDNKNRARREEIYNKVKEINRESTASEPLNESVGGES